MPRLPLTSLLVPSLFVLTACVRTEPARETRVIIQQPAQASTVALAPNPPPPPHSELVPPPPQGMGPVVWQPGHWMYTGSPGNPWAWQPGQYVSTPSGMTTWVPGHWTQQPNGGWFWMEGHWA